MNEFAFVQATKEQAKARVALAGPSGSGKTMTGLILATRLADGGRTAVIDTERGSASKYAGLFEFDRLNMYRYDPRDLPKALASAASQGYASVLIDSLSRFWSGAGGMLEFVDAVSKRNYGGNTFGGGWKEARPIENELIEAMLGYPGHVIVTMRVKTHYDVTEDDRGRKVPVKLGLQPEQRNGIEYEFDVVGDMDLENNLVISKSRCPELSGRVLNRPDHTVAETLLAWLTDGEAGRTPNDYRDKAIDPAMSYTDLQELYRQVKADGKLGAVVMDDERRMVTLADLITRKGKQIAAAAQPAGAGDRAAGQASQQETPPGEGARAYEFLARLDQVTTPDELDALAQDVKAAEAERKILPATAHDLHEAIAGRQRAFDSVADGAELEDPPA